MLNSIGLANIGVRKFIEEIRFKNAEIPIYLYGETRTSRHIPNDILRELHGFIHMFEDTPEFVARHIIREARSYLDGLAPPLVDSEWLLGKPDVGLVQMKDVLDITWNIAQAVNIPVMADVDTGGGNAVNAAAITEPLSGAWKGVVHKSQMQVGDDVVVLHVVGGPALVLHPESARDLLLAQVRSRREQRHNAVLLQRGCVFRLRRTLPPRRHHAVRA